jgi:MFS family permease
MQPHDTPRRVVSVYLTSTTLMTVATSLIWGVVTLYLMESGLSIFQVMLVNTVLAVSQVVFEVPTGVVADTIGRRASYLISLALITISTLLYLAAGELVWGFWGFALASGLLAFAWTFQSGAVEAWLVDALDHTGWVGPKSRVFAWGGIATQVSMLAGTILGGFLGQVDLAWPFVVRACILVVTFVFVAVALHDSGFERRELRWATVVPEMRSILRSGTRHGWRNGVVRPLMLENLIASAFYMYGFYSLQPYILELLGKRLIWAVAAITAVGSLAGILGNSLAPRILDGTGRHRRAARVMMAAGVLVATATLGAGLMGVLSPAANGAGPVIALTALWLVISFGNGIIEPVRRTFINEHIPSRQRATVLSLDAMLGGAGSAVGQPALGWLSQSASIPAAWIAGGFMMLAGLPFLRKADRAAD